MTITPTPEWPTFQAAQGQAYLAPPPPAPTGARKPTRRRFWLIGGIGLLLLAVAAVVVTVLLNTGGGEDDSVTTESGATYQVLGVTVAETAEEATATGLIPLGPNQYLYEPTGSYVIVEWAVSGSDGDAGTTPVVLDGNGNRQESGLTAFQLDVESSDVTQVDVYDVPSDAVGGSQLVIIEDGTEYTLDLGL
jgi:hypothetical protein